MPRMSSVAARRGEVVPRGTETAAPRSPRHLAAPGGIRITPEMLAGVAILSLASVNLFGSLGVLMFIAGSALLLAVRPHENLLDLLRFSPLLLLPCLAIMSTIWSDAPEISMRGGLELLLTYVAAITICRSSGPQTMVLALFIASLIMIALLVPYIPGSLATKQPLVAWMGSKNQVGFTGYLLFALALGVLLEPLHHRLIRLGALASLAPALLVIYLAQSGGTTSTIVLTVLIFPPLALLTKVSPPLRVVFAVLVVAALIASSFLSNEIDAAVASFRRDVLNKDATLTGRTYLWEFAERLAAVRPVWGYGYSAFWRQGNIDAEGLWRWGGIANRGGFNFHNQFIEVRVGLGLVGYYLLIATCVIVVLIGFVRQITRPSVSMACLMAMTLVLYVRSYAEDGLVAQFSLQTLIWLGTAIYAFAPSVLAGDGSGLNDGSRPIRGQIVGRDRALVPAAVRRPLRDRGRSGQGLE